MTLHETDINDWEFEAIQKRYQSTYEFDLTIEQARLIYQYEQQLNTPSKSHYFSLWEKFDFEMVSLRGILTPEQYETYKADQQATISHIEKQMVQQDQEYIRQLDAIKELYQYYAHQLLPALEKQRILISQSDHNKVAYLKAEYKSFLDNRKKSILVNHFRHSKTLQPNLLQLSLLLHQLICLFPDYYSFRMAMDTPTKAIADYLEVALKKSTDVMSENLGNTLRALKEFTKSNAILHLGEMHGWHTTEDSKKENFMFILLLDRQMYSS